MSRTLEKCVVRRYIYPALTRPPPQLNFDDQFAFRPTGSTTAAIIALLHTVRSLLSTNAYVHVIAFDFSKAFDTVRHETMMNKMASLELPDNIYNWLLDFFTCRHHCTGQDSARRSLRSKAALYRAPELVRHPTSSRLETCTPSRPATDCSNLPTTRTWSFLRPT